MPWRADPVEADLDETTAGTVVTISQTDDRKTGSARLKKNSTDGMPLSGAEFALYKKEETTDPEENANADTLVKERLVTEEDGTTGAVEQLAWGTYYFLETKAPQGYEMSTEKHTFTVDASNAGSVQTLQVSNEKIKGSVALTKMDEATKTKKLPDAQFNLYKNDGSGKLGGTTKTTKEFTIQGETVQIFFRSDGSGSNYYGFYAVVEAEVQKTEIVARQGKTARPCNENIRGMVYECGVQRWEGIHVAKLYGKYDRIRKVERPDGSFIGFRL